MSEPPPIIELGDEPTPASPRRRRRLRRAARGLTIAAILLFGASALLWSQRRPIADSFIRDALVKAGVPARYKVEEIGFRTQRISNVVLGNPARPDLTADWVEIDLSLGFGQPEVIAVRAGRVQMAGRVVAGRLRLGVIDRLLPPPSGKPFALPAIALSVADGRARIDTDQGQVGVKLTGAGRLDDGFRGRIAAVAPALSVPSCRVGGASLYGDISIRARQPHFAGPVRVVAARCDGAALGASSATVRVTFDERLDRWRGDANLALGGIRTTAGSLAGLTGTVGFDGGPRATTGRLDVKATNVVIPGAVARAARLIGPYRVGQSNGVDARLNLDQVRADPATRERIAALRGSSAGTPVAPLVDQLADALTNMANGAAVAADIALDQGGQGGSVVLRRMAINALGGARISLNDGSGARFDWPQGGFTVNGLFAMGGGGLPQGLVRLEQARAGGPVTGTALLSPYRAADASLSLDRVQFRLAGQEAQVTARAILSGPMPGGRIDRLTLPIDARLSGGSLIVNPGCARLAFERLTLSSLILAPTRLTLCPAGGAMLRTGGGGVGGAMASNALMLRGTIGEAPMTVAADRGRFDLGSMAFSLAGPEATIGSPDRLNRLAAETLDGGVRNGVLAGDVSGLGGQIARVPLILSAGAGQWSFAEGTLTLTGGLTVSDDVNAVDPGQSAREPRFNPVVSRDVRLTLADGRILATGSLTLPGGGQRIADVTIRHDLARTTGDAVIDVPGIRFAADGLQPRDLTELAFGVVAEVEGLVSGQGTIAWTPEGVTSGGVFRTKDTNLAAAFGPVTGLSGELRFTDLLNLETGQGQRIQLAEVNPGFAVTGGEIRYRLLPGQKVAVEGGRWPLAGGTLVLEPTMLDFASTAPKRMVFRAEGVDAGQFLQQFDFDNLDATGTFDGTIPVLFDASGARVVDGRLVVRPGGGTVAYLGELTEEDLGAWGNFTFQALRSLRYRDLSLDLNGPLAGEMITRIRFSGLAQGEGTKSNFLIRRLAKLPLVFNVRVEAPFLQLIDSVQSVYDPARLVQRNLPALLREQAEQEQRARGDGGETASPPPTRPVIQPSESENRQ